jgi:hypothetical protein
MGSSLLKDDEVQWEALTPSPEHRVLVEEPVFVAEAIDLLSI